MKNVIDLQLDDRTADQVRRSVGEAIKEIQSRPAMSALVIRNVSLASGIETPVPHGLGRAPMIGLVSPPRGATTTGRIDDLPGTKARPIDRASVIVLKASGYGATITVDIEVK